MKTETRFKKGDMVKVINPNNHFYDDVAEVLFFDVEEDKYFVKFNNNDYKCAIYQHDLVRHLSHKEQRELQKAQLLQLADLALMWKDKEWFEKITKRLKNT